MSKYKMTWNKFKEEVDAHLKGLSLKDIEIDYIDIRTPVFYDNQTGKPRYGEIEIDVDILGLTIEN